MNKGGTKEGIMEDNRKGTWEDVTGECTLDWANLNNDGGNISVDHNGIGVAWVGWGVKDGWFDHEEYRITTAPESDGVKQRAGAIKVEHFIPDPEPVIAYKAVRVEDGEWVSTYVLPGLVYAIGKTTACHDGAGIHCFNTLREAQKAYPADRSAGQFFRRAGRVAILEVEALGAPTRRMLGGYHDDQQVICYPSVKVLSVAWEEEKKEEWVDVTKECTIGFQKGYHGGYATVHHDRRCVATLGKCGYEETYNCGGCYRVTFTGSDFAGFFKVEKRNG